MYGEDFDFDVPFFDPVSWEEENRRDETPYPDELWEQEFINLNEEDYHHDEF